MKTNKILFIPVYIGFLIAFCPSLQAEHRYSLYLNGPSAAVHFDPYHRDYNDFPTGFGGELVIYKKRLTLGFNGHYMFKDSLDNPAYWAGFTVGVHLGNKNKIWFNPYVIIGGLKKNEYNSGKFGFFAFPVLAAGYGRFGFNIGFIPELRGITYPILLIQLKFRLV